MAELSVKEALRVLAMLLPELRRRWRSLLLALLHWQLCMPTDEEDGDGVNGAAAARLNDPGTCSESRRRVTRGVDVVELRLLSCTSSRGLGGKG